MAESTTPSPDPKKRNSPHEFDQQTETDLCLGETVLAAANNVLYQAKILGAGIKATDLTDMAANIIGCRNNSSKAVIATNDVGSLVLGEHAARKSMNIVIAVVRKAAKDKFPEGDPARKKYFVGVTIANVKYEDLVQRLDELAVQLASDPLSDKGVSADELTAIATTVEAWKIAAKAVEDKQDDASRFRNTRDELCAAVNTMRHNIQSAADRKFPHTDPANSAARAKFKLPSDKEFIG